MKSASVIFLFLSAAFTTIAQNNDLEIYNGTNENKQICFYDAADKPLALIAFRCETIGGKSTIKININNVDFNVRVFKFGLVVPQELYYHTGQKNIEKIVIGEKGAAFTKRKNITPEAASAKYVLKVCNKTSDEKIYFTLAFEFGVRKPHYSYGWWSVEKNQCLDFPVSTVLKADWNIPYGTFPSTYYYARIYGEKPLVWEGNAWETCVNQNDAFKIQLDNNVPSAELDRYCAAKGANYTKIGMRNLPEPKANEVVYYLNF